LFGLPVEVGGGAKQRFFVGRKRHGVLLGLGTTALTVQAECRAQQAGLGFLGVIFTLPKMPLALAG
jgi:hypothetical protein